MSGKVLTQNRLGKRFKNELGQIYEIIRYRNSSDCDIQFESDKTIVKNKRYFQIEAGIKNPNINNTKDPNRKIFNLFFMGFGKYNSVSHKKYHNVWHSMIRRCYCNKYQLKYPTYIGCLVVEKWYNFQVFAEWCEQNYVEDFVLDKDILIKGNKIYGPDTCCFVPNMINTLFRNIDKINKYPIGIKFDPRRNTYNANISRWGKSYFLGSSKDLTEAFSFSKLGREDYLKELAEEWKPQLDIKTYNALINWKVEITD